MSKEEISIKVIRYRDKEGNPACAANFETGEVCIFYRTTMYGFRERCAFDEGKITKNTLQRRDGGQGTLIPNDNCIVWRKETAE